MTDAKKSLIWTDVDYERSGKQVGWLSLPHSVTRSAYGVTRIPVCVVKNGLGPTVLLQAGNHGDEYEGQIALTRFIRGVGPGAVQSRIIVLPAAKLPAAPAGTRVSPLDGGNLNRAFIDDPERGSTWAIAHYIDTVPFPMCTPFHDYHAGGPSLHCLPFASARLSGDPELDRRSLDALKAFAPPPPRTRFVEVKDCGYYVFAPDCGVFEPVVKLGDHVEAGRPAGYVRSVEDPGRPAAPCRFNVSGMAVCRRAMGRREPGDRLFHLATDTEG